MNPSDNKTLIFFGTPEFSVPFLNALHSNGYNIPLVVSQPDKPRGRGLLSQPTPVKNVALELNLPCFTPDKLNKESIEGILAEKPDVIIVVAYGKIIPPALLNFNDFGCLNIHPSLLSRWRGPTPIESSLLNGDSLTGVTLMKLDEKFDHGPILSQTIIPITEDDNASSLTQKIIDKGITLLLQVLPRYLNNKQPLIKQDHKQATYSVKITRTLAEINWQESADVILNKIRALIKNTPAWTTYQGRELKIFKARKTDYYRLTPGFFQFDRKNKKMFIGTATETLEIQRLQPAGRKIITVNDYINGLKK